MKKIIKDKNDFKSDKERSNQLGFAAKSLAMYQGIKICCGIFLLSAIGFLAYYLIETNSNTDEDRLKTDFGEVNHSNSNSSSFLDQPEKGIRAYPVEINGSGDEFVTDDDEIKDEDFNQYDYISVPDGYTEYANYTVNMGVVDLVESIWNNESPNWKRYGARYAKKLEIYNYEHESTNGNEEIYNYEVKMHSMVGPDHAKQKQIHNNLIYSPVYVRRSIRTKTFEFPYSDTFDVVSLWEFKGLDADRTQVRTMVGMDWVSKPFMIATFIENDIDGAQEKAAKIFKKIFPVEA